MNPMNLKVAAELLAMGHWMEQQGVKCPFAPGDLALDLLGVPADNTVETDACGVANATGEWPEWGMCRDYWYNLIIDEEDKEKPNFPELVMRMACEAEQVLGRRAGGQAKGGSQ